MIAQGTNGLSRGDYTEGVMSGESMLAHVPLHASALTRQPSISQWVRTWPPNASVLELTPAQWFWEGHGLGRGSAATLNTLWVPTEHDYSWILWHPPPTLAHVALDELEVSRHKRSHLSHIFIIPRLLTYKWRK